MNVIVNDSGFTTDDLNHWADAPGPDVTRLHVAADADLDALAPHLASLAAIRIGFTAFSDGRGFTLAARLRRMGFCGRLRAQGHVLADQYAMARRSGFDEIEITQALAARQPEDQWQARADWQAHAYRVRVGRRA
jgi:uncharacterized protein (DUF934 family)